MRDLSADVIPPQALELARLFRDSGFGLWLVGGWVRDTLLGTGPVRLPELDQGASSAAADSDLDFTTDARPADTLSILKRWGSSAPWTTGIEFGTVGVQKGPILVEVTTFRSEVYEIGSRNPRVEFGSDLATDLSRRDFTVNTLAIALPEIELVDLFGGISDLVAQRIRTPLSPDVSFSDDPLRMLRAFRFASTLGFEVDDEVMEAVRRMHGRLRIVSRERIRDEFSKLMLGRAVSRSLEMATETGVAGEFLPELPGMKLEQDPIHRHKDVFHHTLAVLDNAIGTEKDGPDLVLRLGALLHDIGKPKTRQITPKGVTFHHHEVVGAQMAEARMRELRYPAKIIAEVKALVYLHLRFHTFKLGWTDRAVRRYVRDAGPMLEKLNKLVRSDCTTRNPAKARQLSKRMDDLEAWIADLSSREELERLRPALDGNEVMSHLKLRPGRMVGEALDFLMEVRLDEGEIPKDEAYRRLDDWFRQREAG
ncbi:MAG TPA: CCA tRNA nucleotidyltransferase [Actinomycetota bacterium]|nr:CCA tRNA nucleotidyltransferase [Actinomycetota bacterium]